jgi:hypothetical protein
MCPHATTSQFDIQRLTVIVGDGRASTELDFHLDVTFMPGDEIQVRIDSHASFQRDIGHPIQARMPTTFRVPRAQPIPITIRYRGRPDKPNVSRCTLSTVDHARIQRALALPA